MHSGSYTYQKGDLVSIKQSSMIVYIKETAGENYNPKEFRTAKKPMPAIFLGFLKESSDDADKELYNYLSRNTSIKNPCKVAIGNDYGYVDGSQFFYHNKRRKNEKAN